eukprot:3703823-Pleurochrysis_carterae.AAC.1
MYCSTTLSIPSHEVAEACKAKRRQDTDVSRRNIKGQDANGVHRKGRHELTPTRASPLQKSWDDSAWAEPPAVALPARHGVLSVAGVRGQRVGGVVVAGEGEA